MQKHRYEDIALIFSPIKDRPGAGRKTKCQHVVLAPSGVHPRPDCRLGVVVYNGTPRASFIIQYHVTVVKNLVVGEYHQMQAMQEFLVEANDGHAQLLEIEILANLLPQKVPWYQRDLRVLGPSIGDDS